MQRKGWLPEEDWKRVQRSVPIACADVVPIARGTSGPEIGLICRTTPHQGTRWVTIGGRILLNEPLRVAVNRQVREALGDEVRVQLYAPPITIVEYFSRRLKGLPYDPRQHAIGVTYAVRVTGRIRARGEALEFRWFSRKTLPSPREIGFGQNQMLVDCLRTLDGSVLGHWRTARQPAISPKS
jgi:ADP-ribose pyrophosphatase YjhB (NUDIX family)